MNWNLNVVRLWFYKCIFIKWKMFFLIFIVIILIVVVMGVFVVLLLLRYVFYFGKVICVMIFLNIDVSFCFIVVFGIFFVVFLVIIIFVCYVCVL